MARTRVRKKKTSPTWPSLTPRQVQILELIRRYRRRHHCSPTLQEMAQQLGVSKVTVFEHVEALIRKGLLHRQANHARTLTPDARVEEILAKTPSTPPSSREPAPTADGPTIPGRFRLVGVIAAGTPLEAVENRDTLDLAELFPPKKETFALQVRGNSMVEEHIRDGDFVLVEKRSHIRDGDIVVALLETGEATLKKIYRQGRRYRLEGAHPDFSPLLVDRLAVQGVVVGVVRRY